MFRRAIPSLSLLVLLTTFAVLATVVGAETTEQTLAVAQADVIEQVPVTTPSENAVSENAVFVSAVDFSNGLEQSFPPHSSCQTDEDCLCVCFDGGTCNVANGVCNCH